MQAESPRKMASADPDRLDDTHARHLRVPARAAHGKREELEKKKRSLKATREEATRSFTAEDIPVVKATLSRIKKEIDAIDAELSRITEPATAPLVLDRAVEQVWNLAQDFQLNFSGADAPERKRILRPFLRQITVRSQEGLAEVELYRVPICEEMRDQVGTHVPPCGTAASRHDRTSHRKANTPDGA